MTPDAALPKPRWSLQSRVVASVLSLLLVAGVIVALASFAYGRQAARQAYDRLLLGAANDIAESINVVDGAPVADLPISAFQLLALAPDDRISYGVHGPDGALLTGYATAAPSEQIRSAARGGPAFFDTEMQGDAARFVTVQRRFAERDFSGSVNVTVGQTIRARNVMALELTRDALIAVVLSGAALMLLAFLVIRSAMRPLDQIAGNLMARDPYDLTPMQTDVPKEAAVMIAAMNRFMARLDRQFDAMRNLISDAAHQLRTPVAAIRAQAEVVAEEHDETARDHGLERLVGRTRSLGDLLDQMLSRALVIHRVDSARRMAIDLRDIALGVLEDSDHALLAPDVEVRLEIGPDPVIVMADEISLREAVKNMLANALRHGQPPVRLGVSADAATAGIWVEDAGPGIPKDVQARVGERFTRSATSKGQSAGLGLSIVRAVASALEGEMEMQQTETGFRVSLIFARAGEEAK